MKIVSHGGKRYEIMDTADYRKPKNGVMITLIAFGFLFLVLGVIYAWSATTDATDRAWDDIMTLLADNSAGGISAEDLRDSVLTLAQKNEYEFSGPVVASGTVTVPAEYLGSEDDQSTTELWVDGFRWYRSATAARGYVEAGTDVVTVNTAIPSGAECLFRYYEK